MTNKALDTIVNLTARTRPHVLRARANLSANLALVSVRQARIGSNTKINWLPIIELVLVVAAIILCCFVLIDRPVALQRGQLPTDISIISQFVTRFGKSDWILVPSATILLALLFLDTGNYSKPKIFRLYRVNLWLTFIFVGVGLPSLIATILKRLIGRPRPSQLQEFGLYDFQHFHSDAAFASFPSGHSTTIGAFAVVMALLLPKYRVAFAIFAVFVGFSRVGVGAHHPSDVVAGLAFGAFGAFFVAKWFASRGILFLTGRTNLLQLRPAMQLFTSLRH